MRKLFLAVLLAGSAVGLTSAIEQADAVLVAMLRSMADASSMAGVAS